MDSSDTKCITCGYVGSFWGDFFIDETLDDTQDDVIYSLECPKCGEDDREKIVDWDGE